LLASVVESSDDAILSKSSEGVITSWNPAAERLYKWTAAEAVGRHVSLIVPADRADEVARIMDRLESGERIEHFETVRLCKDGTRVDVAITGSHLRDRDGRNVGYSWIARDITARKLAEEALKTIEERLRLFIEYVSAPIAMLDKDMRYLHVSRRWLADYRLGDRDITGLSHYELFPNAPHHWEEIHRRCLAGATDRCEEARFDRGDGSVQWIRWEIRPWLKPSGEVGGIIMFTEDITERKHSEEALRVGEERYRTLIAATTSIVWDSPSSGAFDSEQPGWTAFTGQAVEQHRGWGWL
ncbi:PAS domain-containing protein, partial [Singulisphaera rosea]